MFLCADRNRGGAGPSLWKLNKSSDAVTPLGPIFSPEHPLSWATGEGWYWSATERTILYASDPTHLYRVDVAPRLAGYPAVISPVCDVASVYPGTVAWQWHTSHDGRVHSATLKDGQSYQPVGAVVSREETWQRYVVSSGYDEAQIDQSGAWLLVKQDEDNVVYDVPSLTGPRWTLTDQQGAGGHSDNGFGYMVAADNWNAQPSAYRVWMLDGTSEPHGRLVYHTPSWDGQLLHVSHCNARAGAPDQQYVIGSGASRTAAPRNNELVAFRLDGSCDVLVVAPVLTDLDARGGGSDDYNKLPKANVDVTGEYALWTTNLGGDRLDALLVKIPAHLLVAPTPPAPPVWTVVAPDGTTRRFVEVP